VIIAGFTIREMCSKMSEANTKTAKQRIRKVHTPNRDKRVGIGARIFANCLAAAYPNPFSFYPKGKSL